MASHSSMFAVTIAAAAEEAAAEAVLGSMQHASIPRDLRIPILSELAYDV